MASATGFEVGWPERDGAQKFQTQLCVAIVDGIVTNLDRDLRAQGPDAPAKFVTIPSKFPTYSFV